MLNCIDPSAAIGENCTIGNFTTIERNCALGNGVVIHNNVTLYPGTVIGDHTEVFDGAVIGRPPKSSGNTVHKLAEKYLPAVIGTGCIIGANSVIYAQCTLGNRVLIGDGAKIREGAEIGEGALVAMNCTFNHNAAIGNRSKIIDLTHITANTVVEEDVFVGCGVVTVNDNAMRLAGEGVKEVGDKVRITLKRGSRIGSAAMIFPNIKIGENALVGACALVTRDVPDGVRVMGVPAREK